MLLIPVTVSGQTSETTVTETEAAGATTTVYVIDHIEVGVHETNSVHSAVLELLPSGVAVTPLERDGSSIKVRTAAGLEGWIHEQYLSNEAPAISKIMAMNAEVAAANAEVARVQQVALERGTELERTKLERDELEREAEAYRDRIAEVEDQRDQARIDAAEARSKSARSGPSSEDLRNLQALAQENQGLKAELARISREALSRARAERAAQSEQNSRVLWMMPREPWQWVMLLSLVIFSFGGGAYVMDWTSRRRHGGFRL